MKMNCKNCGELDYVIVRKAGCAVVDGTMDKEGVFIVDDVDFCINIKVTEEYYCSKCNSKNVEVEE